MALIGKKREFIQRIPNHYVGDDCLQIMMGYRGSMLVLSPKDIIYHDQTGYDFIHSYVKDERRKQFPYSNIPVHNKRLLLKKYRVANQLLDFDTPYLKISTQGISEHFAIKDGKEALLITKTCFDDGERTVYLTRQLLEELFTCPINEYDKKIILYNGDICGTLRMPSNDELVQWYVSSAKNKFADIISDANRSFDKNFGTFERLFNNAGVEDIPENFQVVKNAIVLDTNSDHMTMRSVSVWFMSPDLYKLDVRPIPIDRYTLEQLKDAVKIYDNTKNEPKIDLNLNPDISIDDIILAKKML